MADGSGPSEVAKWFEGRNILVTGATGFLGKVLVERILRVCPGNKLYLLLRPKRGKDIKERLEDFLNCQVFDTLRNNEPEKLSTVIAIKADVLQEGLAISPDDRQDIIDNISVVFHCAANVRFDQTLKGAVTTNTLGTKKVLHLAKEIKNLDVFVHVSTAYCHCNREVLEECCYPPPHNPDKIIDIVSWMEDEMLDLITPKLLGGLPNTYAYSKSLSEHFVSLHAEHFPVVIARPSIVIASLQEPMPGWIENLNGPTGLIVGAGKGVLRSMHCKEHFLADIMPVDVCANALIALAFKAGTIKSKEPTVCNLTESGVNPITWGKALALGRKHVYDNPYTMMLWYPDGSIKSNLPLHMFCVIFFHYIPAYFIDFILLMFRQKPFLVNIQKRLSGGLEVLQYYTLKQWIFSNNNYLAIKDELKGSDRTTLFTDMTAVNWNDYMKNYILGARQYCCKESPDSIPRARKLINRLYWVDRFCKFTFFALVFWFLWSYSTVLLSTVEAGLSSTAIFLQSAPSNDTLFN